MSDQQAPQETQPEPTEASQDAPPQEPAPPPPPTAFEEVNRVLGAGGLEEAHAAVREAASQPGTDRLALAEAYAVVGDPWSASLLFNEIGHIDRMAERCLYRALQPVLFGTLGMAEEELIMSPRSDYYRAFDGDAFKRMIGAIRQDNLSQPQRRLLEAVELEIENHQALIEPLVDLYHPAARDAMEESARILREASLHRLAQTKSGMELQALGDILQDYYSRRGPALLEAESRVKEIVAAAVKKAQADRAKELALPAAGLALVAAVAAIVILFV